MLRYSLVLGAVFGLTAPGRASSWADALFSEQSKDFGSVPRGPILSHAFRLTNYTGRPVHISGVRVSCGCVNASALDTHLEPGQSTAIQASMDTRRFVGSKVVTIYVSFDQPHREEVRLWVQANGRDDLVVTPETLAFGRVKRGSMPSASLTVTFGGSGQWQITEVERESNYIKTALQELHRDVAEARYQVTASVRADTPIGKWYTDIWLRTNNPAMPRVRVPLTVEIESALSISPGALHLGQITAGSQEQRKIIVRGIQPFQIRKVEGTDDQLLVRDSASESKSVHVLTVTLRPNRPGEFDRKVKVMTDLKEDSEVEFQARAQVVAARAGQP